MGLTVGVACAGSNSGGGVRTSGATEALLSRHFHQNPSFPFLFEATCVGRFVHTFSAHARCLDAPYRAVVKRAEKEAMRAHREEQRKVNEESVRHLLESQAKEREQLRQKMQAEEASLREFKLKCLSSLPTQAALDGAKGGSQKKGLLGAVLGMARPTPTEAQADDPHARLQPEPSSYPTPAGELSFGAAIPSTHHQPPQRRTDGTTPESHPWERTPSTGGFQTSVTHPHAGGAPGTTDGVYDAHIGNGAMSTGAPTQSHAHASLMPHASTPHVHGVGANFHDTGWAPGGQSGIAFSTPSTHHAQAQGGAVGFHPIDDAHMDGRAMMPHHPRPVSTSASHGHDVGLAGLMASLSQTRGQLARYSPFPATTQSADLRPIPSAWQANAINTRPTGPSGFHVDGAGSSGFGAVGDAGRLENAATTLLNAALTLVGRGVQQGGPGGGQNGQPSAESGNDAWGDRGGGGGGEASKGTEDAPQQPAGLPPDDPPAGTDGGTAVGGRDLLAAVRAKATALVRVGRGGGDGGVNSHAEAHAGAAVESDSDVDDDVPLALTEVAPRGVGGRAVPSIDFSKMPSLKAKPVTRAHIIQQQREEEAAAEKGSRGLKKFGAAARKVENSLTLFRGAGRRAEAPSGGTELAPQERLQGEGGGADVVDDGGGQTNQMRKIAAAKLLMKKAGSVPRLAQQAQENAPPAEQPQRKPSALVAAVQQQQQQQQPAVQEEQQPQSYIQKKPSVASIVAAKKSMDRLNQDTRVAENQHRQFTTEDFRNMFSFARHGKYKQVTELLKSGCPAEGRDQFGNTPLIIACQNGNARIVKALLRHGAGIDAQNKQGCTGLHYCIAYGFNALSDYLIAKGANDKLLNKAGLSPYEGIK